MLSVFRNLKLIHKRRGWITGLLIESKLLILCRMNVHLLGHLAFIQPSNGKTVGLIIHESFYITHNTWKWEEQYPIISMLVLYIVWNMSVSRSSWHSKGMPGSYETNFKHSKAKLWQRQIYFGPTTTIFTQPNAAGTLSTLAAMRKF